MNNDFIENITAIRDFLAEQAPLQETRIPAMKLSADWEAFSDYGGPATDDELEFARRQAAQFGIKVVIVKSARYGNTPPDWMSNTRNWDMAADAIMDFVRDSRKTKLSEDVKYRWYVAAFNADKDFATNKDRQWVSVVWNGFDDMTKLLLVKDGLAEINGRPTHKAFMTGARIKS